jgi:C-terminal processing protease CtpA/Prc
MMAQIRAALEERYYDSTFGGVNLDARFRHYDVLIDSARTMSEIFSNIAQFVLDLNDSHTRFYPPMLRRSYNYGWLPMMIGDSCYVVGLRRNSDAQQKGLAVGDRIIAVDGIAPTRQNLWLLFYVYGALSPRPGMHLTVQKPDGARLEMDVMARVTELATVVDIQDPEVRRRLFEGEEPFARRENPFQRATFGDSVMVWRMRSFAATGENAIDVWMREAREYRALVLDLRGNGGGLVVNLERLVGHFFDTTVTYAIVRERSGRRPRTAQPVGGEPYRGLLVVLVDSRSASAAEEFARFTQLEARSIVVGDRTAGALMTSRGYGGEVAAAGSERAMNWFLSITVADVLMPNGERLEGRGATPDELVLPTGQDLAARRDPQLARALAIAGVTISPEEAGRLYERR